MNYAVLTETELIQTDLLLKIIAEDIKLNHLHFGLQDLGLVPERDILGLSEIIFDLMQSDELIREKYYQRINDLRGLIYAQLTYQSKNIYNDILLLSTL